ncbi:ectonucleoside triphosphate diphosphohydrolase 1-like isoform X2 [Uloborus diversus]|uniref:ectonucleoside triphosphate diphosphohydrolase 1-like isoform X2 n=1 Tax=Uloborus diversus TaxID=327109 RepID=UPI002409A2D6|nr:ectonucleoside triphosphate diphosphohydrolase 1-like isoform X2 [Uloborus diversus]
MDALLVNEWRGEKVKDDLDKAHPMQVILQPLQPLEGSPVAIETNHHATIATLISTFCAQKGIAYSSKLVILDGKKRSLPQFSTLQSLGVSSGQSLHIGYEEKSFSIAREWPLLFAFTALGIGLIGILTLSMIYGLTGGIYPYDYGVVMDAGSSKTNTIVYEWKGDKYKGTGYVTQKKSCNAVGGIAKMNPMHLEPVIECAKNVTEIINPSSRPRTPLFFAATAGMRLLYLTNPTRAAKILEQLNDHLNETGLDVKAIEVITGRDEGIYGWITANFLKETLEFPQKTDPWEPTTYGALDMGGASMQIAFAIPENEVNASTPDVQSMKLYGQTHNVFSHSNLCFGRDEANRRLRFFLAKNPSDTRVYDPCTPTGYEQNVTGSDLFSQPCTESTTLQEMLAQDPTIVKKNYTFVGTSDYAACRGNVSMLLNDQLCNDKKFKECFKKLDNIPSDQKYLAFATYFYTTNFLNVTKSSLEEYRAVAENFCRKNITEVHDIDNSTFVTQYCFNALYIHEVLVNGLGFTNSTWENLQFVDKIQRVSVGWTLGYMINATNLIPEKAKTPRAISATALTISLVLFIIVVIGTFVFLFNRYRQRNEYTTRSMYGQA